MHIPRRKETVIHFVGIGGIGMSGIAEVFCNQGYQVTGSDIAASETTRKLSAMGIPIAFEQKPENIGKAQVVVVSSAIDPLNPEIQEAKKRRIPVIPRAEMLGELMRGKIGIAVAGSHGKTTTTSMLATVLFHAGYDPTAVIGGKVNALGGNAKLGRGPFVVAEADESDGSFLHLPATYGIITNIDNDHLDHYQNLQTIDQAFLAFVAKLPFYGLAALCAEDPGVNRCIDRFTKPFLTYGFSENCFLHAKEVACTGFGSHCQIYEQENSTQKPRHLGPLKLQVPGRHNILNALGVILMARKLELDFPTIAEGLAKFEGVKRRFEVRFENSHTQQLIIDDYAHHPTEIQATLEAARNAWPGRIIAIFQPHRYTRTLHCKNGFLRAFAKSDRVLITDIYTAGEKAIDGIDAESLAQAIQHHAPSHQTVLYSGNLASTRVIASQWFSPGDLIVCLGAGSITRLAEQLIPSEA